MNPEDLNLVLLAATGMLLVAVAAVRLANRAGLPTLLIYLALGLAVGEAGLGLEFENLDLTTILSSIALAMILAEGGFTTAMEDVKPVALKAGVLATAGVFLSVAITGGLVYLILDVDVRTAILLGAVASSTDAAAVFAVLRRLPVKRKLRSVVEAESGFNDPPVIILVTVVTSSAWSEAGVAGVATQIAYQLVLGVVVGFVVARIGGWVLMHSALPSSGLYPLATVAIAFLAYAVAGLISASPFLAIYVAGLVLGNLALPHRSTTSGFVESTAWLAQIGLFTMLGLLASPNRLLDALPTALVVGGVLTFIARPLSVTACVTPFRVPWREQAFISWAGLRGAVPIVLATIPMAVGLPAAHRIFDVVFLLVILFTLIQGPTLPWVAKRLGVTVDGAPTDVEIESSPLDEIDASLLQVSVPPGSRLAGVEVQELRLPTDVVVSLLLRDDELVVPGASTVLRTGDHLLIAAARHQHDRVEHRLREVGRLGRLAGWYDADDQFRARRSPRGGGPGPGRSLP